MSAPITGGDPEGGSAVEKVVELSVARLQDQAVAGSKGTPTMDVVVNGIVDDLESEPDQFRLVLGAAAGMVCAMATFVTGQIDQGDPVTLIRLVANGMTQ